MDGVKTKNVMLSLLFLESKFNPIKSITADAGSKLISILRDNPSTDTLTPAEEKVFKKLASVKNQLPNSQRRNFVERRIRIFKQYLKSAFKTPKNNTLPLLSLQEAMTCFSLICRRINEVPFASTKETTLVCPGTFVYPGMDLCGVELDGISHQFADFTASATRIQRHLRIATDIRNAIFTDISLYEPELLVSGHRKKQIITPGVGDICLVNPHGKFNQGRFGIIISFKSAHTATIRSRNHMDEDIAIINLFVLVRNTAQLKSELNL
jgi:hypothetical protein